MLNLPNVTLLGLDCVDIERLRVARDICVKDIEFGAVKLLTSLPSDDRDVIAIEKIDSIKAYSAFMVKKLLDCVDTEFVLVFQHDGFVLSAANWRDEFLEYDYVGCPWIGYYRENPDHNVGNGGFSLRSKRLLEILSHDDQIELGAPEDYLISRQYREYLEEKGVRYAPEEVAGKFAIPDIMKQNDTELTDRQYRKYLEKRGVRVFSKETEEANSIPQAYVDGDLPWTDQFGFHYLTKGHLSKWLEENPEYASVVRVDG
jgi:hypothetical protein